jgi:hypothetical protein
MSNIIQPAQPYTIPSNIVTLVGAAPLVLTASSTQSTTGAGAGANNNNNLSWNALAPAASYDVFRQINGGGYVLIGNTPVNSFQDSGPAQNWTLGEYDYQIVAITAGGSIVATSNVTTQVWSVTLTAASSQGSFNVGPIAFNRNTVTWNVIPEATEYKVYKQFNGGGYTLLATLFPNVPQSYQDAALASSWQSGEYDYQVFAYAGATLIATSNVTSQTWVLTVNLVWTARTSGSAATLFFVAYGNGVFLTSETTPTNMRRSTDDGHTWSSQSLSSLFPGSLNCAAYGNGNWVAVGGNGKMARSTDGGATWSAITSPFGSVGLTGVCYNPNSGTWCAIGGTGVASVNQYAYSTDSINWSLPGTFSTTGFDNNSLVCDGTQFIAIQTTPITFAVTFATSPTGQNWTTVTAPANLLRNKPIAVGNGLYMCAGAATATIRVSSTLAGLASASDIATGVANTSNGVGYASNVAGPSGPTGPIWTVFGTTGGVASSIDGGNTWGLGTLNFVGSNRANVMAASPTTMVAAGLNGNLSTFP